MKYGEIILTNTVTTDIAAVRRRTFNYCQEVTWNK